MQLQQAMQLFADHHALAEHSPRTIEFYSMWLQQFDQFLMLHDLQAVNLADLRGFSLSLQHRTLSPTTRRGAVLTLKIFFKWCLAEGLIETNPAIRLELPKKVKRIPNSLDTNDVITLINDVQNHSRNVIRDTALIVFIAESGARRAEVCALQPADVHVKDHYALVRGKGGKDRWAFFGEATIKTLGDWLVLRPEGLENLFGLGEDGLKEVLRRVSMRTGVKVHPHLLRRTSATLRAVNGASATDLQLQFGWEGVEMANSYVERARLRERAENQAPLRDVTLPRPTA